MITLRKALSIIAVVIIISAVVLASKQEVNANLPPPPYVKQYKVDADKITVFSVPYPGKRGEKITCVFADILQCDL